MKKLAIIADDLSSATDCSVQLAQKGFETSVFINIPENLEHIDEEIIVFDTNSRRMEATAAYKQVSKVAEMVRKVGFEYIFKTIDSTLRGNLGAEIDALMDIIKFDFALIAPAFPFYGRTTINGTHYLRGIPICQTEIGSDPNFPVRRDNIADLLTLQSSRKSGLINLDLLYQGKDPVHSELEKMINSGVEFVIFDIKNEDDLAKLVHVLKQSKFHILWSGSTGLSRYLDTLVDDSIRENRVRQEHRKGPILIISASASEITRGQIAVLKPYPNLVPVEVSPFRIVAGVDSRKEEICRCSDDVINGIKFGKNVILYVSSSRPDISKTKSVGERNGFNPDQVSQIIVDSLAIIADQAIHNKYLGGVLLNGGDTARAFCTRYNVNTIKLDREIEPGIPLGTIRELGNLPVITKAGAFGGQETFVNILENLKKDE
jgi:uncharacterized protein YgbK (DUF1537 family)